MKILKIICPQSETKLTLRWVVSDFRILVNVIPEKEILKSYVPRISHNVNNKVLYYIYSLRFRSDVLLYFITDNPRFA